MSRGTTTEKSSVQPHESVLKLLTKKMDEVQFQQLLKPKLNVHISPPCIIYGAKELNSPPINLLNRSTASLWREKIKHSELLDKYCNAVHISKRNLNLDHVLQKAAWK